MLEFIPVRHPDAVFSFIENHELGSATWIVSDLKSKNEIQKILLNQQGYFLETSILRVSDFWKIALRRLAPQMHVVSSDFINIIVENFVEKFGSSLNIKLSEASTLHAYLSELAPILLHPESDAILSEWFTANKKSKKWHSWYLLSRACMKFIIADNQVIDSRWIAAYLQNLNIDQLGWTLPLIVDLGTEMSSVEMGLFKTLAKSVDTKILWPRPEWGERYQFLLKTYQDNAGYGSVNELPLPMQSTTSNEFKRVSTQLAEVKTAVAQIRLWVQSGVAIDNIVVIAADMDRTYWPILKYFLDEEGLIYQKDHIIKLNSLGSVQHFSSYVTNLLAEVSWDSLETTFFSKLEAAETEFDQFKSFFIQLYDDSDLLRDDKIKNLFYQKLDLKTGLRRDEFLVQIVKIWTESLRAQGHVSQENPAHLFETIFKDFLSRSTDISTTFKNWFSFLQSCINSKELKLQPATSGGLHILPLMSSHLARAEYQIVLGADEKSLSTRSKSLIPTADVFELKTKFDFAIDYPEESFYDFNIRWLAEKKSQQKIYLCANTSFDAEPLTPALFFLENNSSHELQVPGLTRHDYIQAKLAADFLPGPDMNGGFKRDFFPELNHVPINKIESLSPSEIEDYWKCPFKLLAQKAFRLRDLPQVAVDLDPRQKGSLLHLLFEHLIKQGTVENAEQFLELKRLELKIYPQDEMMWTIQKNKLLQVGHQFQNFESSRKKSVNAATEESFEMYFDSDAGEFVTADRQASANVVRIKGRIDRLDQMAEGLIIYDYKSSTGHLKSHGDWLAEGEFQLLFYLLACEKYLFSQQPVIASLYYDYRKFETVKGFMTESFQNLHFPQGRKKKSLADAETKSKLIGEFETTIQTVLKNLEAFDFSSRPVDIKICNDCNWSKLCRAPHLM